MPQKQLVPLSARETPQFLAPGNRALLFCIGLFLGLQAIFIAVFIFNNIASLESMHDRLLGAWSGFSLLAGALLVIKGSQLSSRPMATDPVSRAALLGMPDDHLTLATLSSLIQEGMALVRDEKIIYANSALAYLLGELEEDLIDTSIRRHIHYDDLALLDIDENHSDLSSLSRATLRLTTTLGDYRWAICNVFYVLWDNEPATLLVFENIGPLKQAQRSLEEHEQQSRIFLERTPLGVAMFDALGQLKIANTAWHSIWTNISGAAAKRYNILQDPLLPRADIERAIRQAFGKKEAGVSNLEYATSWGETRWYNIDFHPMLTPVGNLIGVIMVQQDITDSIRSLRRENELNDQLTAIRHDFSISVDRHVKLMDILPDVLVCFDENGIIRIWNNRAEQHFSLPRQEVMGLHVKSALKKMTRYLPMLQQLAAAGATQKQLDEHLSYDNDNGPVNERVIACTMGTGCNQITVLRIINESGVPSTEVYPASESGTH